MVVVVDALPGERDVVVKKLVEVFAVPPDIPKPKPVEKADAVDPKELPVEPPDEPPDTPPPPATLRIGWFPVTAA